MTADRKWMEQLGFELKHDERQGWLVIEDGADDRCATITEQVLWDALLSLAATVAPAELDVTKILLNVVPGDDGEGLEIYAKSVDDVVALLTEQAERIEELESRSAAPVAPATHVKAWDAFSAEYKATPADLDRFPKLKDEWVRWQFIWTMAAPAAPADPTNLRRADGTLSGVFIEPVAGGAAAVADDLRNWFDFLPGHAQPTIERAVRLLETRP